MGGEIEMTDLDKSIDNNIEASKEMIKQGEELREDLANTQATADTEARQTSAQTLIDNYRTKFAQDYAQYISDIASDSGNAFTSAEQQGLRDFLDAYSAGYDFSDPTSRATYTKTYTDAYNKLTPKVTSVFEALPEYIDGKLKAIEPKLPSDAAAIVNDAKPTIAKIQAKVTASMDKTLSPVEVAAAEASVKTDLKDLKSDTKTKSKGKKGTIFGKEFWKGVWSVIRLGLMIGLGYLAFLKLLALIAETESGCYIDYTDSSLQVQSTELSGCSDYYRIKDNYGKCGCGTYYGGTITIVNKISQQQPVNQNWCVSGNIDNFGQTATQFDITAPYCLSPTTAKDSTANPCDFPTSTPNLLCNGNALTIGQQGYIRYALQIYTPLDVLNQGMGDAKDLFDGIGSLLQKLFTIGIIVVSVLVGVGILVFLFKDVILKAIHGENKEGGGSEARPEIVEYVPSGSRSRGRSRSR
jgi:hypothetical protein